jgi:hypothetical protein
MALCPVSRVTEQVLFAEIHFTGNGVYRALPSKVDLSESVDELGYCPILFARLAGPDRVKN